MRTSPEATTSNSSFAGSFERIAPLYVVEE
jgi:hypothetical protein